MGRVLPFFDKKVQAFSVGIRHQSSFSRADITLITKKQLLKRFSIIGKNKNNVQVENIEEIGLLATNDQEDFMFKQGGKHVLAS